MYVFKEINNSSLDEIKVHKTQNLTSGSLGITSIQYRSGSLLGSSTTLPDLSGSYWNSLHVNFYLSGSSQTVNSQCSYEQDKYGRPFSSLGDYRINNLQLGRGAVKQHRNKFYSSGSVINIPQQYFGETIRRGTFQLTDNSTAKSIIIKDDGYGNLYPDPAYDSSSAATSISSSDNYVGNIFYDYGVIAITETGSWSGSGAINYTDIGTGDYSLQFDSTQTIYVRKYQAVVNPREFNGTLNTTIRGFASGSTGPDGNTINQSPYIRSEFTGSGWSSYVNTIQLYNDMVSEPVMVANLSKPIKIRDDMTITFEIKMDM